MCGWLRVADIHLHWGSTVESNMIAASRKAKGADQVKGSHTSRDLDLVLKLEIRYLILVTHGQQLLQNRCVCADLAGSNATVGGITRTVGLHIQPELHHGIMACHGPCVSGLA